MPAAHCIIIESTRAGRIRYRIAVGLSALALVVLGVNLDTVLQHH